jgi:hypothetical protein
LFFGILGGGGKVWGREEEVEDEIAFFPKKMLQCVHQKNLPFLVNHPLPISCQDISFDGKYSPFIPPGRAIETLPALFLPLPLSNISLLFLGRDWIYFFPCRLSPPMIYFDNFKILLKRTEYVFWYRFLPFDHRCLASVVKKNEMTKCQRQHQTHSPIFRSKKIIPRDLKNTREGFLLRCAELKKNAR